MDIDNNIIDRLAGASIGLQASELEFLEYYEDDEMESVLNDTDGFNQAVYEDNEMWSVLYEC